MWRSLPGAVAVTLPKLASCRLLSGALYCAVFAMLKLSARNCARQIGVERAANTYSFKLQRSWQYQLNFYLHREIVEWSPNVAGDAIVVTGQKNLEELKRSAQIVAVISELSPQAEVVVVRPLL